MSGPASVSRAGRLQGSVITLVQTCRAKGDRKKEGEQKKGRESSCRKILEVQVTWQHVDSQFKYHCLHVIILVVCTDVNNASFADFSGEMRQSVTLTYKMDCYIYFIYPSWKKTIDVGRGPFKAGSA